MNRHRRNIIMGIVETILILAGICLGVFIAYIIPM